MARTVRTESSASAGPRPDAEGAHSPPRLTALEHSRTDIPQRPKRRRAEVDGRLPPDAAAASWRRGTPRWWPRGRGRGCARARGPGPARCCSRAAARRAAPSPRPHGVRDSMPSTEMPCASLSVISRSWGCSSPSASARRRTSSVSSSSRHGGAHNRRPCPGCAGRPPRRSGSRRLVTEELHPQRVLLGGWEDVDDAAPDRELPRFSTRSTLEYAARPALPPRLQATSCPRASSTGARSAVP